VRLDHLLSREAPGLERLSVPPAHSAPSSNVPADEVGWVWAATETSTGLSEAAPHGSAKGQLRRPNSQSPFWERNIMRDLKPEEIGHVYGAGGSGHHHHDHHHGHGTSSKKQNRHGTSSKKHAAKTSEKKTRDCKVA
jgi:hypothetical protein